MSRKSKMPKSYQKTFGHSQLNSHVGKTTPREFKDLGNPNKIIKHHVPPRHPDKVPKTIRVDELSEKCYHHLFGAPKNATETIRILLRDWWPDEYENFFPL